MTLTRSLSGTTGLVAAFMLGGMAHAEMPPTLNFAGVPGLIDTPSGEAMGDGNIAFGLSRFGTITRSTLSFQITPWLSGSFRLQNIGAWNDDPSIKGGPNDDGYSSYNDRSFDLRFHLLQEEGWKPSVTIGLQDIAGTGLYSSEYIAATKTFGETFKVTAGLGWGRLGTDSSIGSPFGERPSIEHDIGGSKPRPETWFKGPASVFGGIEWQVKPNWTVKAEYATDAYEIEDGLRKTFERDSPLNFGIEYKPNPQVSVGLYSIYGSEIGFSLNVILDPKRRDAGGILGSAPEPISRRPARAADPEAWDGGWVEQADANQLLRKNLEKQLDPQGIFIEDFAYTAGRVQLRIRNSEIDSAPQAIGRTARALSKTMPPSVEYFEIVPVVRGMGVSKVTIRRSDLEQLEYSAGSDVALRDRVVLSAAEPSVDGSGAAEGLYPKFTWGFAPMVRPADPLRGDIGMRVTASYEMVPGLLFSGSLYQRLADNYGKVTRPPEYSGLQHVRSDVRKYNEGTHAALERLYMSWYAHPGGDFYSRLSFGYLERMHAGASAEVLWKPVESRWGLGAEVNYTKQRDLDGGFGFDDYDYSVVTGHVSAYYDFGEGYLGQVDVGRYLAGDVGATVSFDREFANGWSVGAFATFTDASAEDFGEGRFDKGIRLNIPMNWVLGQSTRQEVKQTIRPLQRDGGARLEVEGRLYETVRDYHGGRMDEQWGRVWR